MATVQELIERYNAEQVGDRLIAVVDGKKEYIADIGTGGFMLTEHGLKLEAQQEAAEDKPKRKARAKVEEPDAAPAQE